MPLPWQAGPLTTSGSGKFLVPGELPERMPYVEPAQRRLRVRFAREYIADSERAVLLYEPGRYPVAYFPVTDVRFDVLEFRQRVTWHPDLGSTAWYAVRVGNRTVEQAAWHHFEPPGYAAEFADLIAFSWRAMDGFCEEDEQILGHAPDPYHRIDVRRTSRHLTVRSGGRLVATSSHPVVVYESGVEPCWYVPRDDVEDGALGASADRTSCPYKGIATYYDVHGVASAAWSYQDAGPEARLISGMISFDPGKVEVRLDDRKLSSDGPFRTRNSGASRAGER